MHFTHNTKAIVNTGCSITNGPSHCPFEASPSVLMGESGTTPHHMVFCVAGCSSAGELIYERKNPIHWTN